MNMNVCGALCCNCVWIVCPSGHGPQQHCDVSVYAARGNPLLKTRLWSPWGGGTWRNSDVVSGSTPTYPRLQWSVIWTSLLASQAKSCYLSAYSRFRCKTSALGYEPRGVLGVVHVSETIIIMHCSSFCNLLQSHWKFMTDPIKNVHFYVCCEKIFEKKHPVVASVRWSASNTAQTTGLILINESSISLAWRKWNDRY
jgi:hypothetical protein